MGGGGGGGGGATVSTSLFSKIERTLKQMLKPFARPLKAIRRKHGLQNQHIRKLTSCEMKILKKAVEKTRRDTIRNEVVRGTLR